MFEVKKNHSNKKKVYFLVAMFPVLEAKADLGWVLDGSRTPSLRIHARTVMHPVISSLVVALTLIITRVPRKPSLCCFCP